MDIIRKLAALLTSRERTQVYLLFIAILNMAFFDVAGIASIMPFIGVLSNPSLVQTNAGLRWAFQTFGFAGINSFLLFLGIAVLFLIISANISRLLALWFITRFVQKCKAGLSTRLLECYLQQPYEYFLSHNTSDLSKNIVEEVNRVVHNILHHLLEMCARGLLALCIFGLLLYLNPVVALLVMGVLGGSYAVIFLLVRRKLSLLGHRRILANEGRFKAVGEALGGVKDIKILGRERDFLDRFSTHAWQLAGTESYHAVVSQAPKFALETLAFGGMLLIVLYFLATTGQSHHTIPLLALYGFAGYRLMPALQVIFVGVSSVRFNLASLNVLHEEMKNTVLLEKQADTHIDPLPMHRALELEDVTFRYRGSERSVLRELSLKIKAKTTVGFVGTTGSGKTTLIDVILGLLVQQQGSLKVDGELVQEHMIPRWQRNIGYVPQTIYLADDSVVQNIAFGVPSAEIDHQALEQAARVANLHEFVQQELPDGYDTIIGERGVRLSGGQRQRIGIARALYHDPQVLILDEATSALDNTTEEQVMKAIHSLAGKKTILMIAHRLTTLEECSQIHLVEGGRITASGTFAELLQVSDLFRSMAKGDDSSGATEQGL